MKKICEYCNNEYDDVLIECPHCGAPNPKVRKANKTPQTIEELKQWYIDKKLPDENITRFFIGKDYKKPRAFGIYKDENTGNFIVYKNKDNGQRAIRYEGKDESYAVHELYSKLKQEIANQKQNSRRPKKKSKADKISEMVGLGVVVFFVISAIIIFCIIWFSPSDGYYHYNNDTYYYQGSTWYYYDDDYGDWVYADDVPDDIEDYYDGSYYDGDSNYSNFENSSYYDPDDDSDDWDSDSSWDSSYDSWDSGGSDFSSDW